MAYLLALLYVIYSCVLSLSHVVSLIVLIPGLYLLPNFVLENIEEKHKAWLQIYSCFVLRGTL